jgi:sugar phosphate isomerase/epimerase
MTRRHFLQNAGLASAALAAGCSTFSKADERTFSISLAQWSYHKALFARQMTHMDFPIVARRTHDIDGIELVNQFFKDRADDTPYLAEFRNRADGEGVRCVLIMCDGEGALGDPDAAKRKQAVQNHHKWAEAAKFLGCHAIRVNAETNDVGTPDEQQKRAADGLAALSDYCGSLGLNCLVENHGHLSSNGQWLAGVMKLVGKKNCGTLPDFGNFIIRPGEKYDRYQGVAEMMPYAKAVSAKSYDFDLDGKCLETDYRRMMKIVLDAGYRGRVGIEYEGDRLPEKDGVDATRDLLIRLRIEGV